VALPAASSRTYDYTPARHQAQVAAGANVVDFTYDNSGRLSEAERQTSTSTHTTPFLYDGRSFLRHAGDLAATGTVQPRYDSAGLLHGLLRQPSGSDPEVLYLVLSFAGRPVAQVALEAGQAERWWYFTTDHLGTPLVATDPSGAELWHNRFEPFGRDMDSGLPWSALANEIFLRFPGQWEDTSWQQATLGAEVYYNVYRWYQVATSRYIRPDPVKLLAGANNWLYEPNVYAYVSNNPTQLIDPLGLYGTNDCSYYDERCEECGGDYYCFWAPLACEDVFPKEPDPDPNTENDYEGWVRCTRKCLQDCDAAEYERRKQCNPDPCDQYGPTNPDPTTSGFGKHTRCHQICYSSCYFWGTWGGGDPAPAMPFEDQ